MRPPHPIPYQGSKRRLAPRILAALGAAPPRFSRLLEPFAGSAAVTLAAATAGLAARYVIADSLAPLADLWRRILDDPEALVADYERLFLDEDYAAARARYNARPDGAHLLYLLARCVKSAPRWSREGRFNQSPDRRRAGMRPARLRREVVGAAALLAGRAEVRAADFELVLADATARDLVYLDPPWQGTTVGRDRRYHAGLSRERLVAALADLDRRRVPFLLSYDGRCGARRYGEPLPASLRLRRLELAAGRSSQATLAGRVEHTVESLYLSSALDARAA